MRVRATRRGGFTMVELMVAIGVALALLGIAAAVANSSAFESYKTVGAADKLSQWMLSAKSRALRDKKPIGLRLLVGTDGLAREAVFIEQPDPWKADGAVLVVQQVIDEGDPRTRIDLSASSPEGVYPRSKVPPTERRVLSTRVFIVGANPADFEADGTTSPTALVRRGDVLSSSDTAVLPGKGYVIVGVTFPNATNQNATPPTFVPNRPTAAYPAQFHPLTTDAAVQTGGPYPAAAAVTLNPAPAGQTVVELQLGAAPDVDPSAYSKYVDWSTTALPPILYQLTDPATGAGTGTGSTPLGPVGYANVDRTAGRELPQSAFPTKFTNGFGIHRAPRPLLGEPNLLLPAGMAVDFSTDLASASTRQRATSFPTGLAGAPPAAYDTGFDILFAPGGEVMSPKNGAGLYALLLRDPGVRPTVDLNYQSEFDAAGRMALVVVSTRTGTVSTHPVDRPPSDVPPSAGPNSAPGSPYQFAKDGANTGL